MRTNDNWRDNLFERISKGDTSAFREFYESTVSRVYAYHHFLTRSAFHAEELTQELFIKIWSKREQLADIQEPDAWLKVVMRNQAYNYLKKLALEKKNGLSLVNVLPETGTETNNLLLDKEYHHLFEQAVSRLPPQQKNVFLLSRNSGMKHVEIAASLGISIHSVKNHMKAALQSIRIFLKGQIFLLVILLQKLFF
ncbi:RNA polymerase sigma factor [Flavihumibacter petaseus]|uniref:Putative RNA polymerase ECF-type sigma factor n=1 Tax=Flavihumibacter petaseus NBRC 106054 TaxID=1220578 RepID=A0A0E9N1A5_9BACT|nr:RNA polymerase sigma-70 factor [Flavihumibacter petaseus]GAO43523.1 putative RNA polymerase ECF-type sigma factor [Flavihumibacter petaseus NBRC 106054]